ncbi:MAG: Flagellin protein FlaA [uncultured Chloroflexi bacterium]|uniref:Flagellin n=1 Tax=uncultured Chloroflexota bacterium TaxID=166587 RepID=A0A6J4IVE3_9CHLR|nr:MAG: Flagellin protein FlaA [uncultured Chloroflexota bacterium]
MSIAPRPMSLRFDGAAATAQRHLGQLRPSFQRSVERLSSGLRINSARDDAAGLFLSQRLQAQTRGAQQAVRNVQDGISYLQVADGGLTTQAEMLGRMRELAVQAANGIYSATERQAMQGELDKLVEEIDSVALSTKFNGRQVLQDLGTLTNEQLVVEGLRRSWLESSEEMIEKHFGLTADGAPLTIILDAPGPVGVAAYVQGAAGADGRSYNQELHVNMSAFTNFSMPNASAAPFHLDRVIAHEMTHAVMGRTMNMAALPQWFVEGTAELIRGADERVLADTLGQNAAATAGLVAGPWDSAWGGTSPDYSMGYAATKYLHGKLEVAEKTMIDLMDQLEGGATLDAALTATIGMTEAAFVADFKANGTAFIQGMNLADADVGSIAGGNARTVVQDQDVVTLDPLRGFTEIWPSGTPATAVALQAGANNSSFDRVDFAGLKMDAATIGATELDLVEDAGGAIDRIDRSLKSVLSARAYIGAIMNRLEFATRSLSVSAENSKAADSRIRDADTAAEMTELLRSQMRTQSAMNALSSTQTQRSSVLSLLQFA